MLVEHADRRRGSRSDGSPSDRAASRSVPLPENCAAPASPPPAMRSHARCRCLRAAVGSAVRKTNAPTSAASLCARSKSPLVVAALLFGVSPCGQSTAHCCESLNYLRREPALAPRAAIRNRRHTAILLFANLNITHKTIIEYSSMLDGLVRCWRSAMIIQVERNQSRGLG